jgi:hypothetical protein
MIIFLQKLAAVRAENANIFAKLFEKLFLKSLVHLKSRGGLAMSQMLT